MRSRLSPLYVADLPLRALERQHPDRSLLPGGGGGCADRLVGAGCADRWRDTAARQPRHGTTAPNNAAAGLCARPVTAVEMSCSRRADGCSAPEVKVTAEERAAFWSPGRSSRRPTEG